MTDGDPHAVLRGMRLVIDYQNALGAVSRYTLVAERFGHAKEPPCLVAHLPGSKNWRNFRLSRITQVVGADGERVGALEYFRGLGLGDYALKRFKWDALGVGRGRQSPAYQPPAQRKLRGESELEHRLRVQIEEGTRVLNAVARADGPLQPAEVEVVVEWATAFASAHDRPMSNDAREAFANVARSRRAKWGGLAASFEILGMHPDYSLDAAALRTLIEAAETLSGGDARRMGDLRRHLDAEDNPQPGVEVG